jgi:hypothetical protein
MKKNRRKLSGKEVMEALEKTPIDGWEYKHMPGERIGPMAQDMEKNFGIGTGRMLPPNEMASLSLAAVKELSKDVEAMKSTR